MTVSISASENLARLGFSRAKVVDGMIYGDPYTYQGGVRSSDLRSGVDGPHTELADSLCSLNGRYHE